MFQIIFVFKKFKKDKYFKYIGDVFMRKMIKNYDSGGEG